MSRDVTVYDDDDEDESPYARIGPEEPVDPPDSEPSDQSELIVVDGCGSCCMVVLLFGTLLIALPLLIPLMALGLWLGAIALTVIVAVGILGLLMAPFVDSE